jgi:hypothetical protein
MGTCIQNPLSGIPSSQLSNFSGTSTIDVDIADSLSYRTSHGTEEKELMHRARAVRQRWKIGDIAVPYPPGLYPPSMPKLADVLGY